MAASLDMGLRLAIFSASSFPLSRLVSGTSSTTTRLFRRRLMSSADIARTACFRNDLASFESKRPKRPIESKSRISLLSTTPSGEPRSATTASFMARDSAESAEELSMSSSTFRSKNMFREEISFKSQTINLQGTLSLPNSNGVFPCVVMVHGSGQQDRDGNINGFDTNIFKQLSKQITEAGFSTFCYDKRGAGKSEGDFKTSGLEEVVLDAHQAINAISAHKQVNANKIYVLGHSEGACLAPEIANNNEHITGLIMLCASLRGFEEDGIKNAEVLNRDLDALEGLKGMLARLFLYTKDPAKTMRDLREKVESTDKPTVRVGFSKVSTKFYRETFNYDVKSYLAKTIKPILAIGGEKDFQCHPDDTKLIAEVTTAPTSAYIIENMDHTLRSQTGLPSIASYKPACKNDIMPEVAMQINDWLSAQFSLPEKPKTPEKLKTTAIN